jgi:hypothetical protein
VQTCVHCIIYVHGSVLFEIQQSCCLIKMCSLKHVQLTGFFFGIVYIQFFAQLVQLVPFSLSV